MRLKYYLRGLGLGIIFAVIIMMIGIHNHGSSMSDSEIIERAKELGMGSAAETATESLDNTENTQTTEASKAADSGLNDTQSTENTDSESDTATDAVQPDTQTSQESGEQGDSGNADIPTTFTITVSPGDTCRMIAERLQAAGLVDDSEKFRIYMGQKGVDHLIKNGDHVIPVGASYDEIVNLLTQ